MSHSIDGCTGPRDAHLRFHEALEKREQLRFDLVLEKLKDRVELELFLSDQWQTVGPLVLNGLTAILADTPFDFTDLRQGLVAHAAQVWGPALNDSLNEGPNANFT